MCNSTVWVNLQTGGSGTVGGANDDDDESDGGGAGDDDDTASLSGCASGSAGGDPCLLLDVTVVPLTVEVTAKFGGRGGPGDLKVALVEEGVLPYLDSSDKLDTTDSYFKR